MPKVDEETQTDVSYYSLIAVYLIQYLVPYSLTLKMPKVDVRRQRM